MNNRLVILDLNLIEIKIKIIYTYKFYHFINSFTKKNQME